MRTRLVVFSALLVLLSACTSSASSDGIEVSRVRVVLPGGDSMGGMDMGSQLSGYMEIKNTTSSDDRLVGATCDFADIMMHETKMNGDIASMNEIASMDIPAGATVEFENGGLHIMFMNLKRDLKIGEPVSLTLQFEKAGHVTVTATITDH
jgi:copper(I)-binding protein